MQFLQNALFSEDLGHRSYSCYGTEGAAPLFPLDQKRLAYLEQTTARLYRLLEREDHWAALAAIVDNLLAREILDGEEVEDIVQQWLR